MKKILFIAFYYNYTNEIASKRLRGISKYLPKYGFEPIVIVPKTSHSTVKFDNVQVIETEYENMLSKFMPSKKGDGETTSDNKENKLMSKAISIAGEVFAYPDGMKYWKTPAFNACCEIIEKENISGIISSSFPITSHLIAHDLKEKYDIPWIADLRDLWNLNPYINHTFIRNHFEKRLEMNTFKNVDVLTTTTPLAKKVLQTLHPSKRIVPIVSGYDPEDFKNITQTHKTNELTLMYAGSLYGGKRDPSILFEAISQLISENKIPQDKIIINFYGDTTNLKELSEKYNIPSNIKINGKISHEEVLKNQANSDVLLLISWINKNEEMFIPGKIYEYMASKKPVLSLGYKEGSLKELIERTNIGYHVSTVEESKKIIYDYYQKYINNELEYTGNEFVEEYSMENTAKKFSDILEEIT
ncbi:glycosyl transferase GT4 family protein [Methanobrevibacter sp. YE315]|uniref:glycosyltransferase n=1 Tax=Methanobrevibacter sp. YE315 TaxID=1609968 RepID=UPI000764D595|nr:glycosyltransferase [Methanobrevibacter sp. YE315]AMD18122.1 glycosyl transferase GT4 family protein [Methanobrevibacter sp. YE315]